MKTSSLGVAAIAQFEALRTTAYRDAVGVWTIGYGHTAAAGAPKPAAGMKIAADEANAILRRDLTQFEAAVNARLPSVPQNVFDGAVSFAFNVGTGGFRKASWPSKYLAGQAPSAEAALKTWNKGGGHVLAGLIHRRALEADMIFRGRYPQQVSIPMADRKPTLPPEDNPPIPTATSSSGVGAGAAVVTGALSGNWWLVAAGVVLVGLAIFFYVRRKG